jgi:SAM-dependent methyltransferase
VPHLDLAAWAEIVVIHPASAAALGRIAQGICSDVISALAISARCPVLIVPSMNDSMYTAPSVQRSLSQLREDGFFVVHPASGLEVAEAPPARAPALGAAPPAAAVVDLIGWILAERSAGAPPADRWEELYRSRSPEDLPWFAEELDADMADALSRCGERGLLLDVGAGLGTAAIAAARRGFSVVAIDTSPRAIALARERAGALPIVWAVDDICSTRLQASFDVVLDRGCLHALPPASHRAYAEAVARLTRPGGWLILKCHSASEARDLGTQRFDEQAILALLGGAFDQVSASASTLPGPEGAAAQALLCMLRRRG